MVYLAPWSLAQATLPEGLQSMPPGDCFNQSLAQAMLPEGLLSMTFGEYSNQSWCMRGGRKACSP